MHAHVGGAYCSVSERVDGWSSMHIESCICQLLSKTEKTRCISCRRRTWSLLSGWCELVCTCMLCDKHTTVVRTLGAHAPPNTLRNSARRTLLHSPLVFIPVTLKKSVRGSAHEYRSAATSRGATISDDTAAAHPTVTTPTSPTHVRIILENFRKWAIMGFTNLVPKWVDHVSFARGFQNTFFPLPTSNYPIPLRPTRDVSTAAPFLSPTHLVVVHRQLLLPPPPSHVLLAPRAHK